MLICDTFTLALLTCANVRKFLQRERKFASFVGKFVG